MNMTQERKSKLSTLKAKGKSAIASNPRILKALDADARKAGLKK